MAEFHETMYGKRFFDGQLPRLIAALESIAATLDPATLNPTDGKRYVYVVLDGDDTSFEIESVHATEKAALHAATVMNAATCDMIEVDPTWAIGDPKAAASILKFWRVRTNAVAQTFGADWRRVERREVES